MNKQVMKGKLYLVTAKDSTLKDDYFLKYRLITENNKVYYKHCAYGSAHGSFYISCFSKFEGGDFVAFDDLTEALKTVKDYDKQRDCKTVYLGEFDFT